MAVHLSGRQRDFLSHTFPRPPGDGWAFVQLICLWIQIVAPRPLPRGCRFELFVESSTHAI